MHWRSPRPPRNHDRAEFLDGLTGFAMVVLLIAAVGYLATHLG